MLSQIIFGARVSVIVGLVGASIATLLTLLLGMLSGYVGGRFDMFVQRIVDGVMSMPGLVLVMAAVSMVGASLWSVIIVLGILWGIGGSRIIRGAVIHVKGNAYVESARAIGTSTMTIIMRHILPNIMAPVIVNFSLQVPSLILTEASLSFSRLRRATAAAELGRHARHHRTVVHVQGAVDGALARRRYGSGGVRDQRARRRIARPSGPEAERRRRQLSRGATKEERGARE